MLCAFPLEEPLPLIAVVCGGNGRPFYFRLSPTNSSTRVNAKANPESWEEGAQNVGEPVPHPCTPRILFCRPLSHLKELYLLFALDDHLITQAASNLLNVNRLPRKEASDRIP